MLILPIVLEESKQHTLTSLRKTGGCQHVTSWTCKTLTRISTSDAQKSHPLIIDPPGPRLPWPMNKFPCTLAENVYQLINLRFLIKEAWSIRPSRPP